MEIYADSVGCLGINETPEHLFTVRDPTDSYFQHEILNFLQIWFQGGFLSVEVPRGSG